VGRFSSFGGVGAGQRPYRAAAGIQAGRWTVLLHPRGDRGVPDIGVDLDQEAPPMTMGSDSGWLILAGTMARPRATPERTSSGVISRGVPGMRLFFCASAWSRRWFSRMATNSISGVMSPRRA
jgi:hypothetical protein